MAFLGEVHGEKPDVGVDVGVTQVGIELDAVEGRYAGRQPHQVAEMQVAVAVAHEAVVEALPERRLVQP